MTGTHRSDARTRVADAWRWLLQENAGRGVSVLLLLLLSVAGPALLFHPLGRAALGVVLLGLPSLLTLLAFILLARTVVGRDGFATAAGCLAYLGVGTVLSLLPLGYLDHVWQGGSAWVLLIWPSVTLLYLGPVLGWWPDHAE